MTKQNPPTLPNSQTDISIELSKIRTMSYVVELQLQRYVTTFMKLGGVDCEDSTVMQGLVWIMNDIAEAAEVARDKFQSQYI